MGTTTHSIRVAAVLGTLLALQACSPPARDVFYDPWQKYELGRVHSCDEPWDDIRHNTANAVTANLGCAHQSNLSLVVADPRDLERPRTATSPDLLRRRAQLEKYREGKTTAMDSRAQARDTLLDK